MHGGLVADRSKASKQARWMERKFCFISDAGNWGLGGEWAGGGEGEWRTAVQRPIPPHNLDKQRVRAFIDRFGGWDGGYMQKQHSHL